VAKMTPGAWDVQADASDEACVFTYAPGRGLVFICTMDEDATNHEERDANAAGIVALRNAAPALLDELEAARAVLDTAMISGPPDATWRQLLVARAAWLAWQARQT